jgi:hypothetical protein
MPSASHQQGDFTFDIDVQHVIDVHRYHPSYKKSFVLDKETGQALWGETVTTSSKTRRNIMGAGGVAMNFGEANGWIHQIAPLYHEVTHRLNKLALPVAADNDDDQKRYYKHHYDHGHAGTHGLRLLYSGRGGGGNTYEDYLVNKEIIVCDFDDFTLIAIYDEPESMV